MRRIAVALVILTASALLAQAGGAQQLDLNYLRQAVVNIPGRGTVFGPNRLVVTTIHGSGTGPEGWAALTGYAYARGYKPPLGIWKPDDPYARPARILCARKGMDVGIWKVENLPEDLPSLPLGRGFTGQLWVLAPFENVRARFIGYDPKGVGSARGPLPELEIDGTAITGWSGSPIVNWKGELVAMLLGASQDGKIIAVAPSEMFRCP